MRLSEYNKFLYALVTAIAAAIGSLILGLNDGELSAADWLQAAIMFLGPIVVLVAPRNEYKDLTKDL